MNSREHYLGLPEWVKRIILDEIAIYYLHYVPPVGHARRNTQPHAAPHEIVDTTFRFRCHFAIRHAAIRRVRSSLEAQGHKSSIIQQLCEWFDVSPNTVFRATLDGYASRRLAVRAATKRLKAA